MELTGQQKKIADEAVKTDWNKPGGSVMRMVYAACKAVLEARAASVGDQGLREAAEDANEALRNILNGNDLALERGQSIENWKDSPFRKQGNDAYHALREVLTRQDGPVIGDEPLTKVLEAALRMAENKYRPWAQSGGAEECPHGINMGIACRRCDELTVKDALSRRDPESTPPSQQEADDGLFHCAFCKFTGIQDSSEVQAHVGRCFMTGTSVQPSGTEDVVEWMCAAFGENGISVGVWRKEMTAALAVALDVALAEPDDKELTACVVSDGYGGHDGCVKKAFTNRRIRLEAEPAERVTDPAKRVTVGATNGFWIIYRDGKEVCHFAKGGYTAEDAERYAAGLRAELGVKK